MKIGKWKMLSEKTRFKNPWWKVVEQKFLTPNGKKIRWFIVKKPNAVCVFCLTKKGKVVAIRHYRPGADKIVWDLPTGYINKGETPLQAAKRELREETGFSAKKFIPLGAYAGNAAGDTVMLHSFLAVHGEKAHGQDLDESEEIEVHELEIAQLMGKIKSKAFIDSTRVGVVFLALEKLGLLKVR
ncbi:MAG TPA: NUDIX hydrolase [Candidatus Norongarragalinales archaeon]|nr:NUDIX hydrolase [Candidatus Norongarragalinales archaeon]